jgi:hypothetical protein
MQCSMAAHFYATCIRCCALRHAHSCTVKLILADLAVHAVPCICSAPASCTLLLLLQAGFRARL